MTTFVLVPGACHGDWWYAPVVEALAAQGHHAVAVTPSGLDPDTVPAPGDDAGPPISLETHLGETVAAVDTAAQADAGPLVLVGHSYGGMLITAAADRRPEAITALVYLDAFVPEDGDTCFATTDDAGRAWYVDGARRSGLAVDPLPFFDGRARPHPIGTLLQAVRLTGAWRAVPVRHFVLCTGVPGRSAFADVAQKVRAEPDWTVHTWQTRHNVLHDGPARVLDLLHTVATQAADAASTTPGRSGRPAPPRADPHRPG